MLETLRTARRHSRPDHDAAGPQFLMIVARDHSTLLPRIRRQFLDDPRVQVIVDRRKGERRRQARPHSPDRRRGEQRHALDYWEDLRYHPVVLILAAGRDPDVHSPLTSATAGGTMEMAESAIRVKQPIDQLLQWLGTGQELLGRVAPSLVETVEDLRRRTEAAEWKTGQLSHELEERHNELVRLQVEVERLTGERTAIAEAVAATVRKVAQLRDLAQGMKDTLGRDATAG